MKRFVTGFFGLLACGLLVACSYEVIGERKDTEADIAEKSAAALIVAVNALGAEGVPDNHYDIAALQDAVAAGDPVRIRSRAETLYDQVAMDVSDGLTAPQARIGWRMEVAAPDAETLAHLKEKTFDRGAFAETFASLAPKHEQYALLKAALGANGRTPDKQARLRLNMDRWRWMPDNLGTDYILVNIPAFELMLVREGNVVAERRVITGTPKRPTPQFETLVTGVILNPTWFVPPSIVAESVGAIIENDAARAESLGYYVGADGNARQKPGPANALGRMKLVMPNPYSVFLHDTPSKAAFDRETRALSHGCIRVEDALGFARALLGDAISDEAFNDIIAKGTTEEVDLAKPVPVYIGYFTAFAAKDGAVRFYPDVYGLDATLLAQFGGAEGGDQDAIKTLIEESCPESAGEARLPEGL